MATMFRGWALVRQGECTEGMVQLQQALTDYRITGAEANLPQFLTFLAEGHWRMGRREEALDTLADALAQINKTDNRFYEAELHRLKGTLTIHSSRVSETHQSQFSAQAEIEAESCFHRAIEVARRQEAKSLELRAVTSLARLWQQQGKKEEARNVLAGIYDWFSEGFDTVDLKEAKALLEELT
jgi:predicted ATPase